LLARHIAWILNGLEVASRTKGFDTNLMGDSCPTLPEISFLRFS
jgi:hypothetical protein